MNPKIEILMATYNGEKFIKEQIDSIINQNYCNWRLLIRDDGSKDETVSIVKEYEKKDNRIKLIEDDKGNLGFAKNFEELIINSKAKYIMFSDQDDYWMTNKLEIYINELNKLPKQTLEEALLLHSNSFVCDENLTIIKKKFINSKVALQYEKNSYFFSYTVQGSTVLINRKLINMGIPFLKTVTLHDRYFHLLSEFFGKRIFIDKSLMKYRQHFNNKIGAKSSVIKKILTKRYFEKSDRELILEIKEKYVEKIKKEKLKLIDNYLEITDRNINRIMRFIKSFKFKIDIKKRIFMLFKG